MAPQRQLALPAYLVAFALMFIPVMDTVSQVLPFRPHDVRWRWGFVGLLTNALMIPLVGLLIAYLLTVLFEHRRLQKVLGIAAAVLVLGILGAMGVFALDSVQARGEMGPKAQLAFMVATTQAIFKAALGMLTLVAFAWASLKAPKASRSSRNKGSSGLIIGQPAHSLTPKSQKTVTAGETTQS